MQFKLKRKQCQYIYIMYHHITVRVVHEFHHTFQIFDIIETLHIKIIIKGKEDNRNEI